MSQIEWKVWNGVPVSEQTRNMWAEDILADEIKDYASLHSGNSVVIAFKDAETGEIEFYDCLVLRKAIVRKDDA